MQFETWKLFYGKRLNGVIFFIFKKNVVEYFILYSRTNTFQNKYVRRGEVNYF